jgi:hypothetical protein
MDEIKKLLSDGLYDSKDWRASNTVERIEWLISMLESKNEEIDMWLGQLAWAHNDRDRLREDRDRMASLAIDNAKDTERAIRLREALKKIMDPDNFENIFEIAETALKENE